MAEKYFVPIFGMHRSGTSCLSGIVQDFGIYFHAPSQWNRFNLKGNQENDLVVKFHDDLLKNLGTDWTVQDPADCIMELNGESFDISAARQIFEKVSGGGDCFGFKDPRSTLFAEQWREVGRLEGREVRPVGIFRNPALVAASLNSRDKFVVSKAINIWITYNKALLEDWKRYQYPLFCFSVFPEVFEYEVLLLRDYFSELPLPQILPKLDFFDRDLVHHDVSDTDVSQEALDLYSELTKARFEWLKTTI